MHVVYVRVWFYYSDLRTHYLDPEEMTESDIALFRRCIAFLQTETEYKGPPIESRFSLRGFVARLLGKSDDPVTLFTSETQEGSAFFTEWWPFPSASECVKALQTLDSRPE